MASQAIHSGTEALEKLALALAASLILHLALIFGMQIRPVPATSHVSRMIQARLLEPTGMPDPKVEGLTFPEPDALVVKAHEPILLPSLEPAVSESTVISAFPSAAAPESSPLLPSIEIPLIEDPSYYSAKEVDVHPAALQVIQPVYPAEAALANVTGSVVLVLLLDESGRVRDLSVEEASPPGMFEQSALEAFRNARFSPAQRHGRVVKSRVRIKVNFELTDRAGIVDKAKQK